MKILRQQVVPSRHTLPLENVIVTNWRKRARWSTIEFSWGLITMQFWIWWFQAKVESWSISHLHPAPPLHQGHGPPWPRSWSADQCLWLASSRADCHPHITLHTAHRTLHTSHCTLHKPNYTLPITHCTGRTNWLYSVHSTLCNIYPSTLPTTTLTKSYSAQCTHFLLPLSQLAKNLRIHKVYCHWSKQSVTTVNLLSKMQKNAMFTISR